jgi:hypothetical protein
MVARRRPSILLANLRAHAQELVVRQYPEEVAESGAFLKRYMAIWAGEDGTLRSILPVNAKGVSWVEHRFLGSGTLNSKEAALY